MRVRAHAKLVAAIWLSCQVVAFAAAPFVLCHDHGVMSQTGHGHECDPSHHHHRRTASSPESHEHHHGTEPPSSGGAAIDCRCTISDAALAALTLDAGILTGQFALDTKLVVVPVVRGDYAAPTRSQHPDTPPPRA
jgi:hypothetical protein